MANFKQAPELKFSGKKPEGQYYTIPQNLADIIFNKLEYKYSITSSSIQLYYVGNVITETSNIRTIYYYRQGVML